MIKGANKNPECLIDLRAADEFDQTIWEKQYEGRLEPSIVFLEFHMEAKEKYPKAKRFSLSVVEL